MSDGENCYGDKVKLGARRRGTVVLDRKASLRGQHLSKDQEQV